MLNMVGKMNWKLSTGKEEAPGEPAQKRLNPLKNVVKTAVSGRQRITKMISNTFSKARPSATKTIPGGRLLVHEDEEEDCHEVTQLEVDTLRTFSPLMVHRKIHRSKMNAKLQPSCQTHFGAVLFADISGFTRLANLLSVEQLQIHISNYFSMLFECVEQFGGDILKICGDAIMIMWPLENNAAGSSTGQMVACALTACLCGRELLLSCGSYRTYHGETEINLSLHCGVGVADVTCYWVGKASRWEFLITGDTLKQIASTEPEANSGEIVISPETYELVKQHLAATSTPKGNYLLTTEITTLSHQHHPDEARSSFIGSDSRRLSLLSTNRLNYNYNTMDPIKGLSDHPTLQFDKMRGIATSFLGLYKKSDPASLVLLSSHQRMGRGLKYYVHKSARPRLRQLDHTKEFEMAELREVVTIFINITGLEDDFRMQRLEMIQKVMSIIVESHMVYGGTLRQFVVDDKGCVAIGALGVPHHTYEDNGVRAVNIANMIRNKMQSLGKNCSIGISAGRTFCGLVGSANRREYAMMGSSVNLAARLMCSCPIGGIVVDERVRAISCELLLFDNKGTIIAKGYVDPVPIFAYQQSLREAVSPGMGSESYGNKLIIGRKDELDSLRLSLKDYVDGIPGFEHQFHFLEGEEGIGKSLIAKEIAKEAVKSGTHVVLVTGSESLCNIDYWLLSNILDQFMSIHEWEIKESREKEELERECESDHSSCPSPLISRSMWSLKSAAFNIFEPLLPEDLPHTRSKTERFRDWVIFLLSANSPSPSLDHSSPVCRTTAATPSPSPAPYLAPESRSGSMSGSLDMRKNIDFRVIHGYQTLDLVHLMEELFHDNVPITEETPSPLSPSPSVAPLVFNPRVKDLLLKTLTVRTLRAALELNRTVLVVDNLQWCDERSAQVLLDLVKSSDTGFGIFCYRNTASSIETEQKTFATLRSISQRISLPSLRSTEVSELAYLIMGASYRSCLNRERLSRILTRTQGIPGLVESLVTALRDETDRGLNPNIEDIRIPGQQSIVQKFDALDVNLQLLIKTAAAVGITFSVSALKKIYTSLAFQASLSQNGNILVPIERIQSISVNLTGNISSSKSELQSQSQSVFASLPIPILLDDSSSRPGSLKSILRNSLQFGPVSSSAISLKQLDAVISPRPSAPFTPLSSPLSTPGSRSRSPINILARQTSTQEMFQRNRIEADIERLVALGMFTPCDFHAVKGLSKSSNREDDKNRGIDKERERKKDSVATEVDTPEIGIHAWQWHDARGIRRRGWAAISVKKKKDDVSAGHIRAPCKSIDRVLECSPKGGALDGDKDNSSSPLHSPSPIITSFADIFPPTSSDTDSSRFFKFSHPSIQSTAYSLSLQLDRVPVHAATIEYLTNTFGISPGVEEACLYHSLHLNDPEDILIWLFKCAVSARNTMRHGLFVQRATQVLSTLVKADQYSGELDDQMFATIERYIGRRGVLRRGVRPSVYPYSFSNKKLPDWYGDEGKNSRNDSWLLSIGCIMRDAVCAMVKIGEFRFVLSLHMLSEKILHSTVHRTSRRKMKKKATASVVEERIKLGCGSGSGCDFEGQPRKAVESRSPNPVETNSNSDTSSNDSEEHVPVTNSMYLRYFFASSSADSTCMKHSISLRSLDDQDCRDEGDRPEEGKKGSLLLKERTSDSTTSKSPPDFTASHAISVNISNYNALLLDNTVSVDHVAAVHILAYIRGHEALAVWNILRGNLPLALHFITGAIKALQNCESSCYVLYSICYGRLLALKSLCCPAGCQKEAAGYLEEAQKWVKKTNERAVWGCVQHFNGSILPQLPGLKDLHRADSGEWVVLTVTALELCGTGKWEEGGNMFVSAQTEIKEINDRVTLFQIKLLHAWGLFLSGDLPTFHSMIHSITTYSKQSEELLIKSSLGTLLAIRFSLSCFYDAAEMLISQVKGSSTPVPSPISTPTIPTPRTSIHIRNQSFSTISLSMNGPSESGTNIFLRVADTFLVSRRSPGNIPLMDITILCAKMAIRSPCTYIGGVYLFFTALAGLTVYEHYVAPVLIGEEEDDNCSDNSDCRSTVSGAGDRDADGPKGLLEGIESVLQTLDLLATKHIVLLYMSRAMYARLFRAKGCSSQVIRYAVLSPPVCSSSFCPSSSSSTAISVPHPAESLPLGSAYLKMEIALFQLAIYDATENPDAARRRLTNVLRVAEESLRLFITYEANAEIELLRTCIANTEKMQQQFATG